MKFDLICNVCKQSVEDEAEAEKHIKTHNLVPTYFTAVPVVRWGEKKNDR